METLKQAIQANPWEFSTERSELISRGQLECLLIYRGDAVALPWEMRILGLDGIAATVPVKFAFLADAEAWIEKLRDFRVVDRCGTELTAYYEPGSSCRWKVSRRDAETGELFSTQHFDSREEAIKTIEQTLAW